MELLNNMGAIIEIVDKYKQEISLYDFVEIKMAIKNIVPDCLDKLAVHYGGAEKKHLFSPTNYAPYNWFRINIGENFHLEFRGEEFEVDTKTIYKSKNQ